MCDCGSSPCGCKSLEIPRGPRGLQGIPGPAPDIDVNVTTLPEGSPATATITGTSPNLTLDLGIPAGATGAQGTTGANGVNGVNAFTFITSSFTQPNNYFSSVNGGALPVLEVGWIEVGQVVFVGGGGYYRVVGIAPVTPGYTGPGFVNMVLIPTPPGTFAPFGTVLPANLGLSPAGEPGVQGIQGIQGPAAANGATGAQGPAGGNGLDGTRIFNFPGVPPIPSLVGANVNDYMVDTTNRVMYNWPALVPDAWNALFSFGGGGGTLRAYRGTYGGVAPVTIPVGGSIAANWQVVTWDTTQMASPIATLNPSGTITLVGAQIFNIEASATIDTGASRSQQALRIQFQTGSGWNELAGSLAYAYTTNTANDLQTIRTSSTIDTSAIVGFTGQIRVEVSASTGVIAATLLNSANSINITAVQ